MLAIGLLVPIAHAQAPIEPILPPKGEFPIDTLIYLSAHKYGVDEAVLRTVLRCESQFNPNAIGDGGNSYGIAQIHLPSHPDVEPYQALDPAWAIDWTARHIAARQGRMWTCYRMFY